MCRHAVPLCLGLLHALRLEADPRFGPAAAWLTSNALDRAGASVRSLAELLASHLAPPGEAVMWPHEQAVLEALARVEREPDEAEHLLAFLPPRTRFAGMALLTELSRCISAELVSQLRRPNRHSENRSLPA